MSDIKKKLKDFVTLRRNAYAITFQTNSPENRAVLLDLARFCRANESTFHTDARVHAVLEGRREVYLRIMNHINLDSETLYKMLELANSNSVNQGEQK